MAGNQPIPFFPAYPAPAADYLTPFGLQTEYPITQNGLTAALWHGVQVDWATTIALFQDIQWPAYFGDVDTIQLTIRPGYPLDPDTLLQIGWQDWPGDDAAVELG